MLTEKIARLVKDACMREANPFGKDNWEYHILSVAENAKILAEKLGEDTEIVELAAYLHDYAGILNIDFYPEHHLHGARFAEEILSAHNYPAERIKRINHCILSHRGSKNIPPKTLEAKILCSADALAHFDNIPSLLYLAYIEYRMGISEGEKFVLDKLKRSYKKIPLPQARKMASEKFEAAIKILKN